MWKLPLPDNAGAMAELVTALSPVGAVAVPLSDEERAEFVALYEAYDRRLGNPSAELQPEGISRELAQAVHDGYDSTQKGGRLKRLRERLQASVPRCPFCGFAAVTALDHHLPRSDYKALAVYCRNLIPACGVCNQKKGKGVGGDGDHERFLNAYFYEIPDERFFRAECSLEDGALVCSFEVVQTPRLAQDVFERLTYQFEKLELNRRLQPEVTDLLLTVKPSLQMMAEAGIGGADAVATYLRFTASSHQGSHGLNHWKTAVFHGLAECPDFCENGHRIGQPQLGA
ncbi:HNH endonuclease [Paraburkholderia sediminicola]|uniref:HNH endonuclease n=1 Tax=Paraburkholderia rhynchosiae TaxID=487049 RepID=A0ACC7NNU3_9BURK